MKKTTILTILSAFLLLGLSSTGVQAATLTTEISDQKFEDVTLLKSAQAKWGEATKDLKKVNHGLRKKAVFGLVPVRVYVLEVFAQTPEKLVKTDDGIMNSLKDSGPMMLHITFLRDLPGSKISDAFTDGLKSNKINVKQLPEDLSHVINEIKNITEFKKGDTFSIIASWTEKGGEISLHQKGAEPKVIVGGPDFTNQFLSIWFGEPTDSKLETLKKDLLK